MTDAWCDADRQVRDLVGRARGRVGVAARALGSGGAVALGADESFGSASLIKVPVLVSVLQQAERGTLALSQRIRVDSSPAVGGSGVLANLSDITDLSVRDLAELMIVISDNLATNLLIEALTAPVIADSITAAGLTGTRLQRRLMDTAARSRGLDNRTCAADMAALLTKIALGVDLFATAESYRLAREVLARQQVNDRLPVHLPAGWSLAHKTGELDGVRHDAGFASANGRPVLAIAVLTEGFGTAENPDAFGDEAAALVSEIGRIVYSAAAQDVFDS